MPGAGPYQCSTMAEVARPGKHQPHQHSQGSQTNRQRCQQRRVWNELLCLSGVRNAQSVGGQQVDEWLFLRRIPLGISHQPLLELRKDAFSLTGGAARIESI